MKKIINLLCASMLLLVGCTEDVALEVNPVSEPFFASVEGTTRTYADENGKLLWTANDRITIFKGTTYPLVYQFTGSTGDNYGGFNEVTPSLGEFETSNALSANYAVYPYDENTSISNSGVINYTIPTMQTYAENSFGLGANVMVAVTENTEDKHLSFKNVGGYFEFSLYGEDITVDKIEFSGNNGEKLAGDVSITATHDGSPVIAFADDATTTLTLDCGEGVELGADEEHATKFWIVVPAITYEDGITITITDNEGKTMQKSTSKEITIDRSTVQPLAAFKVETNVNTPPNNQICYTSTDGEVVMPYKADVFGANIVSNVYENGRGVITFDGNVTSIGYNAFYDCFSLTSITLPGSVTSIGDKAFAYCSSLTSITIPDSVTSIGNGAFAGCSSLASFDGKYASADNRCLIVDGELISFAPAGLTSYTIPDSVTSIGGSVFGVCRSLESITIPNSVISIGVDAFSGCPSLTSFYGKYASVDNRCLVVDGELIYFAPAGLTSYTIPNDVTSIGSGAFVGCKSLTSITIPNSVTSIGDSAFSTCSSLTSITIPNSVTSIGSGAFVGCKSLASITIPNSVTSIGGRAFYDCSSLPSITIPSSVTAIGYSAFGYCRSLTSITLPDSDTSIGVSAFEGCSSLTSFYGKYASADNRCLIVDDELISFAPAGLTSYTIPDSVTAIGDVAFSFCGSLESITIPSSVTAIGSNAFSFCSSLTTIYCKPTMPPMLKFGNAFDPCQKLNKIYVPEAWVDAYRLVGFDWSNYADKIEGYDFSN